MGKWEKIDNKLNEIKGKKEEHILDEVKAMITGEKKKEYGKADVMFGNIANYWNTYLLNAKKLKRYLTKRDVAMLMVLFKMARLNHEYKEDSIKDMIGYASLYEQLEKEEEQLVDNDEKFTYEEMNDSYLAGYDDAMGRK